LDFTTVCPSPNIQCISCIYFYYTRHYWASNPTTAGRLCLEGLVKDQPSRNLEGKCEISEEGERVVESGRIEDLMVT
jgi:hypothetical protein